MPDDQKMARTVLIRDAACVLAAPGKVLSGPLDILISGGRITQIAPQIAPPSGVDVVSGVNRLVAPGLVNAHWHSPMQLSHGTADRTNHKVFMWENQVDTANRSSRGDLHQRDVGCLQMLKPARHR